MAKLTKTQTLILWSLLGQGGESNAQTVKPRIKKADRLALVKAGIILAEQQKRKLKLEVTDKGWAWAADNLGAELPSKSYAGSATLREWLKRLQAFMRANDISLADVLGPQNLKGQNARSGDSSGQAMDYNALRQRIRTAYLEVTGGSFNKRALLRNLRAKMPSNIDRVTLDEALKRMQREEDASLMQLDNRIDITEADRDAAIRIGSESRHILWISR